MSSSEEARADYEAWLVANGTPPNLIMPTEWRTERYVIQSAYRGVSEPSWLAEYRDNVALSFVTNDEARRVMRTLDDNHRRVMFRVVRIITTATVMED
jgi:hypothetical protein